MRAPWNQFKLLSLRSLIFNAAFHSLAPSQNGKGATFDAGEGEGPADGSLRKIFFSIFLSFRYFY
jgi:hypothetical protein